MADTTPDDSRGTAFGIFNLVTGFTLLAASSLAGFLWHAYGSSATFVVGAIFAGVAALSLTVMGKAEVIAKECVTLIHRRGPWRNFDAVEFATLVL
ncbi:MULTISPECIES: hypothetical protein [Alphaproteobacteria]|uniref:Major facilitator superfamily (MFS) profile domain-containing protein n=2 Tax=Alphaproteobacteria TaxID=28211 RepID=A0A512HNP0_9HYPH|nr:MULTISPECIES: hypothetical protein [Alphaproteobacteria]GEO87078.1 hypothetical protein RNA01_40100 [Ciceribacter naphthalenivorans]GLR23136.1 hypothetical protein GCM10007920_29240 [Ciceribacter naphthalenivorans]GLT05992.1 hypothetical protein GCM10007926_29240 [Sphingomonas psychrolutea]